MTNNSTSPRDMARRIEFVRSVRGEFTKLLGEDRVKLDVILMLLQHQFVWESKRPRS